MKAGPAPVVDGVEIAALGPDDAADLQGLLERCEDFQVLINGAPAAPDAAVKLLASAPPGHPPEKKQVLGVRRDGALIGAIDLLQDYPAANEWYLGLLLLEPGARNERLGRRIVDALAVWVVRQDGRYLRLVVQDVNVAGARFWRRCGFRPAAGAAHAMESRTQNVTRLALKLGF
jgi:ribosomal protein S18 acetylase RimI-like enzyme